MYQLTDVRIRTLQPGKPEFHPDGNNLFVRVQKSGHKSFVYRYQYQQRIITVTIGTYPTISLATAREEAKRLAALRLTHPDLAEKRRADEAARKAQQIAETEALVAQSARMTVEKLFDRWQANVLAHRADQGQSTRRLFKADVFPQIGAIALDEVTRAMVADVCDRVKNRGSGVMARNLFGELRQMFGFAIKRGLLEADPTSHLQRKDFGTKRERERVLADDELRQLLGALPDAGLDPQVPPLIKLVLATGCRIGETVGAEWAEIDFNRRIWRIPASRTKNGREHSVFLSRYAIRQFRILGSLPTASPRWVFPATFKADASLDPKAVNKQLRDRQLAADETPLKNRSRRHTRALCLRGGRWTPHDLRRTAATLAASQGTDPHVVERMLNHVEANRMIRTYQRADYTAEKRRGWRLLGCLLYRIERALAATEQESDDEKT